jgi:hypothetical protein
MVTKLLAGTVAAALLVLVPAGVAQAKNGADDPAGHCRSCDDGPRHR